MFEAGQPLAHPLEGPGELADLVSSRVGNRLPEIAARDPLGGALEPSQPTGEHRRRAVADDQGRDERDQARDQEPSAYLVNVGQRVVERGAEEQHIGLAE